MTARVSIFRTLDALRGVAAGYRFSASKLLSRAELALIRRMPFRVQSAYILELRQVIQFPQQASSMFGEIFINEVYRPVVALPPNPTIVDLGTNLGIFCMYINQLVSQAQIYGFEANPRLFPYLEMNIRHLPDHKNRVDLFNVAVSSEEGFLDFTLDHANLASVASTAFLDTSSFPDAANYRPLRMPCARLDKFVPGRIDFLKCDIEGAEYSVLQDGLLAPERVGQAAIEFHDLKRQSHRFKHIIEAAFANGYALYGPGSDEMRTPHEIMEGVSKAAWTSTITRFCARDL